MERGITQVQMAKLLGGSQSQVSLFESGKHWLHGERIARLAQVLDVSADELLGIDGKPRRAAAAPRGKFWKTIQLAAQLPERDQRAVARLINSLVASQAGR